MEVFSVFATMSLVDMLSNPLERINKNLKGVDGSVSGLGKRMGALTMSMMPVVVGAGLLLGAFGLASAAAIKFESSMADVAKVVNFDTQAEFQAMSKEIMDMAGRIPMAASGIAAIIAAAGQSGVAKQDLTEFAEQAAKMGVAFDLTGDQAGKMMADWRAGMNLALPQVYALADAVNHLSNNMNAAAPALGEVIQRVGAVAMSCGLAETQVAALGAAFLSAGASPEVAATALKKFTTTLVKGTAMSKDQAAAFQSLGFSATQMAKDMQNDAQGTIFKVLQALADKPKELQMSLLTEMFGEEAIGAIAPLLQNMGNLSQAFELVSDSTKYAGSMQAEFETRSKTVGNALQLLSNKLTNLGIAVGNVFLPAISGGATLLGGFADALRSAAESPIGQWLIGVVGGFSALVVGIAATSAAMWFFSAVGPLMAKKLLPLKTALMGISAPMWAVIAVIGALYLAYKTNFAGIADTLDDWWKKATLVGKGVLAVFESLKDGTGEIKGELATEIKAAGLTGLVTTVSRVVFRVRAALLGFRDAFAAAMHKVDVILVPVRIAVAELMMRIGELFGVFDGGEVDGSVSVWTRFGETLGQIAGGAVQALAQGLVWLMDVLGFFATVIGLAIDGVAGLANWLRDLSGASTEAAAAADPYSWQTLGQWVGYAAGAVFALKAGLLICKGVMLVTSGVMKVWAAAVWLVNAALSANPIVWIIVAIIGLIAAITLMVQNWDWICQKWDEVWAYVGGIIGPIWDSIWGTITSVWQSIVDWVVSVGQTLWSGLETLWDSIVLGAQESWDSLVSSVSGIGQRISDKLLEMWAGVTGFFDGINLYESGAKLLNTFVDGIKSMASAPIKAVEDVLAKVREYLPFSDAHTGPLSQLTLSGTRMMTTIGEGVGQGAPGLVGSVSGALSKAGAAIGGWWASITGAAPEAAVDVPMPPPSQRAAPDQAVPQELDAGTLMAPLLADLADMRTSVIDVFTGIDLSESGAKAMGTFADGIKNMADLPIGAVEAALARFRDLFPFSDTHAGPLPQFTLSALPEQPGSPELSYRMPEVPGPHMEMPRIPEVPALRFAAPQLPEIPAPTLKYSAPELPEIAVDERQSLSAKDGRQGERPAQQSWTVTIQELHLPEVKEANDFVSGLMGEMAQYGEA
ncbi:phage tail tape measure protein [uncultured Bilophila sp.]|uniref:phage tail tape measure protein n=1 Tax=uncultured Bilophila sp. TaxID=529385 RepID=UPI00280BE600|nr:phage tail tape measure protein [uncultured Bilophila sp.]